MVCIIPCFLLLSCEKTPEGWLVKINNSYITQGDLQIGIQNLSVDLQQQIPQENQPQFVFNQLVQKEVLYQQALSENIDKSDDYKKLMDRLTQQYEFQKKQSMVDLLLRDKVDSKLTLTNEEIVKAYNENKQLFNAYTERNMSHILVKTSDEANAIFAELKNGSNFESLAKAKSIHNTAQNGGAIGYVRKGTLVPEFENAGFSIKKAGGFSRPVKTELGYHIIKLNDIRQVPSRTFEEAKQLIANELYRQKQNQETMAYLEEIKDSFEITENLPEAEVEEAKAEEAPAKTEDK